jgi:hypothetical protein
MSHWGTPLWKILHGTAEKIGYIQNSLISQDEMREVVFLLNAVEAIMPCDLCRKHYKDWKAKHPISSWPEVYKGRPGDFRERIRRWLWELHENVNHSKGLEHSLPFEKLSEQYGNVDLVKEYEQFRSILQTTGWVGKVLPQHIKLFTRHFTILNRLRR